AEADITDTEFEQLLDSLDAVKAEAAAAEQMQGETASGEGDEITDAEFESLLDQLHGKGTFQADALPAANAAPAGAPSAGDDISEH
ncbi:hypothetical protein NL393_36355, partial [Klebsiella pneumoniae]|nr:hypothetical protein [Klebsiella pneumoniae]